MLEWIASNLGTIIVLLILAVVIGMAIRSLVKQKKSSAACGCGCGCAGCAMEGVCHTSSESGDKYPDDILDAK